MKRGLFLMVTFLLALFLAACNTNEGNQPQTKEDYQAEIQARLDELKQQIEDLNAEGRPGDDEIGNSDDFNQTLQNLQAQADEAAKELEKFSAASAAAWEDFKPGLERALDELEKAYQKARTNFEES
jgi:chromosome segregation ATPase